MSAGLTISSSCRGITCNRSGQSGSSESSSDAKYRVIAIAIPPTESWMLLHLALAISTIATASLGDRILNSFNDLHYGTFWGLPSRIFYVFVGFAPLILLITGFLMWKHRYQTKSPTEFIKRSDLR